MKSTMITTAALTVLLCLTTVSFGQSYLAQLQQQYQQLTTYQNQLMRNASNQINQKQAYAIKLYRKETGDYSSSNQVVWAKLIKMSQKHNPQLWANMYANQRKTAAREFQRRRTATQKYWNDTNAMRRDSRELYNRTTDRTNKKANLTLRGESQYVNPNTGQLYTIPHSGPNTVHRHGNTTFHHGSNGQIYQYHNGYRTLLNQYR